MAEPRPFLQRWLRAMAATAVLGGAAIGAAYLFFAPKSDIDGLASVVPASVSSGVFLRGIDRWMPPALELLSGARGTPESRQAIASLRADSLKEAGFDVTDPKGWRQAGFEIGGTWGAVSLGTDPEHAQVFALLPVRDAVLARAALEKWLTAEGAQLEQKSDRGHPLTVITWKDATQTQERPGAMTQVGGYLVLGDASGSTLDAPSSLLALVAAQGQPSLRDAPAFKAVRAQLGERWAALLYSSPDVMQGVTKAAHLESSPLLKGLGTRGGGAALELSNTEVTLKLRMLNDPAAGGLAGLGKVEPNGLLELGGDALAVARVSINLASLDEVMDHDERTRADRDRFRASLKDQYGIDLSTEVLHNVDGQFAAAVLTPLQSGSATPDAIATVGVKDVNLAADSLDRVATHLRGNAVPFVWTTSGVGERWTSVFAAAGGLAHGHLYAVEGAGRDQLVLDAPVPGTIPMTHTLPEAARTAFASGATIYAYVDLARLLPFANGLVQGPTALQARQALQGMQAASLSIDSRDAILSADFTLYATPGGWGLTDAGAP